jgi:hypothetical protein
MGLYQNRPPRKKIEKIEKSEATHLVSVTEKIDRLSGIPRGRVGSHVLGKLDAHIGRRSHYRRGYLAVYAGYGVGHEVRGDGELQR